MLHGHSKGTGMKNLGAILLKITRGLDRELQSESQVVAETYHQLRCKAGLKPDEVILEAPYSRNRKKKCDILVKQGLDCEVWIEVKGYFASETPQTRSRKHTGKSSSPINACNRLLEVGPGPIKVLIVYRNCSYKPRGSNSWGALEEFCHLKEILLVTCP